jgi:arylsulfatase A-like enzyme
LSLLLAYGLVPAEAVTRSFPDEKAPGAHDIRRVVVDNTGPQVRVTVWHAARHWRGRVLVRLDTTGGPRWDRVASVRRGDRAAAPTFSQGGGSRWRCRGDRSMVSHRTRAFTRLTVPRWCVDDAPDLRVKVVVHPRGGRTDERTTHAVPAVAAPTQTRPNVLVFVVDDARADDLSAMPKTKRWLQAGGTSWTNALSPYPLCCPARSSILTGQYTHNHDVFSHEAPYGFHAFDDRSTLATWLDDAGYETMLIGKYLNGYGSQPPPGADTGRSHTYAPPGWDDWRASFEGVPGYGGLHRYFDTPLTQNRGRGIRALTGRYQTDAYGEIVASFVARQRRTTTPYFSYVSFTAPHAGTPRQTAVDPPSEVLRDDGTSVRVVAPASPRRYWHRFQSETAPGLDWHDPDPTDQPPELQAPPLNDAERAVINQVHRKRLQALAAVDDAIDRVMTSLRGAGELANTYVLFTSDNGYFLGEHGIRLGKLIPYGSAARVPLLIRGPGIPAGQMREDPFLTIDLAPTVLQMAEVPIPATVDGLGMLPVARGGDTGWTRPVLVNTGPSTVVRDTDESGSLPTPVDPGAQDQRYLLGVRTARFLYTHRASGFEELYDLQLDPDEYHNLVTNERPLREPATPVSARMLRNGSPSRAEYVEALAALRAELARVRACAGEACRVTLPEVLR